MTDLQKFDTDENPLPDENAADSFFALLDQNIGNVTGHETGTIDVFPAFDIRVTPLHQLGLKPGDGNTQQPGGQLDLVAEPLAQIRSLVLRPVPPKPQKPPGLN